MKGKVIAAIVGAVVVVVAGAGYVATSLTNVGQGEVGIVWTMKDGVQDKTLKSGTHWVGQVCKSIRFSNQTTGTCIEQQSGRFQ